MARRRRRRSRCRAGGRSQPEPRGARAARGRRPHPQRDQPGRRWPATASSRAGAGARAARVLPRDGHRASPRRSWARALLDYEDPQGARHRRPAVARLRDGRLRGRRRRARDRLRPRRARARALEPQARQEDHRASTRVAGGDRRVLHARGRARSATSTTCSRAWPRSAGTSRTRRVAAPARRRPRPLRAAKDDDAFPMQPPRALWEIRQALGPRRHPHLRRRAAQAVDRRACSRRTSPTRC